MRRKGSDSFGTMHSVSDSGLATFLSEKANEEYNTLSLIFPEELGGKKH